MAMLWAGQAISAGAASALAVTTPPNLGDVLVGPPEADYVEHMSASGPLDATTIASRSANSGDAVLRQLSGWQFLRGYQKAWSQQRTRIDLTVLVFEFRLNSGATGYYSDVKSGAPRGSTFKTSFNTPGLKPAYGYSTTDGVGWLAFPKGNLFMIVGAAGTNGVPVDLVLSQGRRQYDFAPSETIAQPAAPPSNGPSLPLTLLLFGLAPTAAVVVFCVLFVLMRRSRQAPHANVYAALSADRRHWWDGTAWQDASTSIPPGVPKSADGAYWFDGVTWRRVR